MASLNDNDFIDRCIEEYNNGKSIRSICKDYNVDRRGLRDIFLYKGVTVRSGVGKLNLGSGSISEYISKYKDGNSINYIHMKYGIDTIILSYILHSENVSIRKDGRKSTDNPTAFLSINDEYNAYMLGFFYADAHVYNDNKRYGVDITLAYKDYDHLCVIRNWLSLDRVIRSRTARCNGSEYPACRLTVCSKTIAERLILLGCTNRKSLTLEFPTEEQVPRYLLNHFMRGYFDGDGSVGIYNNGKDPRISLDGTISFLTKYYDILSEYGIKPTRVKLRSKSYSITKSGRDQLKIIYKFLYENSTIHLERKKIIFDEIVNNCPYTE